MSALWQRLKQRKLVQWAVAYVAAAFALLQGVDIIAQQFGWSDGLQRGITLVMVLGFFVALVLAWYHGERGAQKVSGIELLILSALLVVGGGLLWHYTKQGASVVEPDTSAVATESTSAITASAAASPSNSVAVLAFTNLSDDRQNEYFSDGVSEELLNVLARLPGLKVTARTSSFFFKGQNVPIPEIAARLGVAYVVEGSVRKAGDKVRITAQLIKAEDGFHVWSENYDRQLDDIFAVQEELATSIAKKLSDAIGVAPTPLATRGGTRIVQAHDDFLRGRQAWNLGTHVGDLEAVEYFERALKLDPDYALAHGALAEAYVALANDGGESAAKMFPLARAAAERALALDPNNVQAHTALAEYAFHYEWDWDESDRQIEQALAADPNYAMAYSRYAGHLVARNRLAEGFAADQRTRELDPVNQNSLLSAVLMGRRRYAEAIAAATQELKDNPSSRSARQALGQSLSFSGQLDEAVSVLRAMALEMPEEVRAQADLGWALGRAGKTAEAREILDRLSVLGETRFVSPRSLATVALGLQDNDRVFLELNKAMDLREPMLPFLGYDPVWDPVRDDPRFRDLLKRLKLDAFFPPSPSAA